jgi:hypothetical protein
VNSLKEASFGGGVAMSRTLSATGLENYEDSATSTSLDADVATAFYKVVNADSVATHYVYAASGQLDAYAEVGLTATNAESIVAGASATSNTGLKADVSTEVTEGSLVNYYACASADDSYARAAQGFDSASGKTVEVLGSASDSAGYSAASSVNANNGFVSNFWGDAIASPGYTNVFQQIAGGAWAVGSTEGDVTASTTASDTSGDYAGTSASIKNGGLPRYLGIAEAHHINGVSSFREVIGAQGDEIDLEAQASSQQVDAESKALLEGDEESSATLDSSSASASASGGHAHAENSLVNGWGAHITAQSRAYRPQAVLTASEEEPTDFQSQTLAEVFNGRLTTGVDNSFTADAYDDYYYDDYIQLGYASTGTWFTAAGDSITAYSGGSNSADQHASVGAQVSNGGISSYSSRSDASMSGASAGRDMYGVSGSDIDFGAQASDDNSRAMAGATIASTIPETDVIMPAYLDYSYAYSHASQDDLHADNSVGNAQGGYIHAGWEAYKSDSLSTWGGINVLGSEVSPAYLDGYFSADYWSNDMGMSESVSGRSDINSASGQAVNFGAGSDNLEGDHSEVYGLVDNGYVNNYALSADASSNYVSARIWPIYSYYDWDQISGQRVELGWNARNAEGDVISGKTVAQGYLPETDGVDDIIWTASVNNYDSYVSADAHFVQSQESIGDASGLQVSTDWSASNREGDGLNGMIVAQGKVTSEGDYTYVETASLSGGKATQAGKRGVDAMQGGYQAYDEYGNYYSSEYFSIWGTQVDGIWNANDALGEKIEGSVALQNGFLNFYTEQSARPFAVDSYADWWAWADGFQMDWSASDRKKDIASVSAYGALSYLDGESSLSARTTSAEAISSVYGETYNNGGVVGFGLQAQNKNNDYVASGAATRMGTLEASNHARATTASAEGSENLLSGADQTEINWLAQNKEGDTAYGMTSVLDGTVEAGNSVKSTTTSAEGSEEILVYATGIDSQSSSTNARGDIAQTYLKTAAPAADVSETSDMTYALYSSDAKATKAAASASQDVTDSEGSFIAGGRTGHIAPSMAKSKAPTVVTYDQGALSETVVEDGSEVVSSARFQSDASGATASQTVNTENEYGSIALYGGSGKGYMIDESALSELTTYAGTEGRDGSRFTSEVNAAALWGKGSKPALTATTLQSSDVAGASIANWRGAAYNFDGSTEKFAGSVHSQVMVTEGTMVSSNSAEAKKDSAIVKSTKLEAAGEGIDRWFEAHSVVGDVKMDAKITSGTLTDTSYSATATPTTATLSGKWSATGATINKNGRAKSIGKTTPVTINKDLTSPAKNIADSAKATKTSQSIS